MADQDPSLEQLQNDWKHMFQQTLPKAATSKSQSQPTWPVHVDHCFARIILDAIVGVDTPWMEKIKSPAYKNMSREQLEQSIELGQKILDGEVDLVELDEKSLEVRGKTKRGRKRKMESGNDSDLSTEKGAKRRQISPVSESKSLDSAGQGSDPKETKSTSPKPAKSSPEPASSPTKKEDLTSYLKKIALSQKTAFQKKVLTTLCQVPRGRYTTYGSIAKHLSSSARAVGNALRNNPFAPQVPCHRVLATGGGLGGFHGSWGRKGEEGLHDDKKRRLLREEGVRFDGKGRVVGAPWEGFT
ncbi:methylated-DNA--cysteine S-methyltransferase [Cadophora sp. MPI-SDFR-AT-0126]|nr:methylated-DNA--cysteine S-methyltransferase [Leotiomycetes sp. MPI-SDFR-AT-0126]